MEQNIKNGRFYNPHQQEIRRGLRHVVLWKAGFYREKIKPALVPKSFSYPLPKRAFNTSSSTAMWINHSTFLVSIDNIHILTDPIWSKRCSPVGFLGPKRRHEAPINIAQLPPIDYVLISHNHYDHLDRDTVRALHYHFPTITWIVPSGLKKWFAKEGITQVVELAWWEKSTLTDQYKVTAVPAQHFSGRSPKDINKTLWAGYVFETPTKRFYFAGDTGYNPHDFKKIGQTWGHMDLSLIPIGSYQPRRFMGGVHIDPLEAVRIHKDVISHVSVGMHWKTFRLSDEPAHQPPYDLYLACLDQNVDPTSFVAIDPGQIINW